MTKPTPRQLNVRNLRPVQSFETTSLPPRTPPVDPLQPPPGDLPVPSPIPNPIPGGN